MTVASKFLDTAIDRYEKLGLNKHKLSAAAASVVAIAFAAHVSYPHISKWISGEAAAKNRACSSNNTSSSTSDDEDFDSDIDDFDSETIINGNDSDHNAEPSNQHSNNNNTTDGRQKVTHASGEQGNTETNCENDETETRLLPATIAKRKRKHSRVIKQQIKQAEKLLAAANKEHQADGCLDGAVVSSRSIMAAQRIGLNIQFLFQLKRLIEIMIPKLWCRETTILGVHTMCLLSRTFLSFYVASIEGSIVKYIVRKDFRQFVIGLLKWFGIAVPATFINSMIRYLENKLALSFR